MCIAFYTLSSHPAYSLVLATNRDEFLQRPTLAAHWHGKGDTVLSGIDVTGGGTWFGVERKTGKFGLLTNVREEATAAHATSRGKLVSDWLESDASVGIEDHLENLQKSMSDYAGFNLLIGQISRTGGDVKLGFLSNRSEHLDYAVHGHAGHENLRCIRQLQADSPFGVMSNGALACAIDGPSVNALNTAWPKMQTGNAAFQTAIAEHAGSADGSRNALADSLFAVLDIAPLPIKDKEDVRSTVLVKPFDMFPGRQAWYATRAQSVLLVERGTGKCHFSERQAYEAVDGKPTWNGQKANWVFSIG